MKVLAWVAMLVAAHAWTYVTITSESNERVMVSGLIGLLTCLLFAYFSLSITIYDANGSAVVTRYPSMAAYGLALAAPNLYYAYTGPLEYVREQVSPEVRG